MNPALQALTIALLIGWPLYNVCLAIFALRPTRGPRRVGKHSDFQFWIVIPALNEEAVIWNTVTAALALNSPETPVRVMVVNDGSDDGTATILSSIASPRLHVIHRRAPNAREGKGEALNAGYRAIRTLATSEGSASSTIVGIIDGDGRADPLLLHQVVAMFSDREVGAVQCRVRIHNRRRILGLLQDIEFGCIANASQSLRDRLDSVGMGGNGQFTRLSELIRHGGSPWSSCLVEDMELGLRLHLDGSRIRYCSTASITQQAVVDLRRLLRQRTRWAQGNLQCARYVRGLTRSRFIGSAGLLDFLYYLIAPWLAVPLSILVAAAATIVIVGFSTGMTFGGMIDPSAGSLPFLMWVVAIALPGMVWGTWHWWRLGDETLIRCLLAGVVFPLFLAMGIIASWRAVGRHMAGQNGWTKTERIAEDTESGAATETVALHLAGPIDVDAPASTRSSSTGT